MPARTRLAARLAYPGAALVCTCLPVADRGWLLAVAAVVGLLCIMLGVALAAPGMGEQESPML